MGGSPVSQAPVDEGGGAVVDLRPDREISEVVADGLPLPWTRRSWVRRWWSAEGAVGVAGVRVPRLAAAVHGAGLAVALGVWLYLDRGLWFFGDEWDFLVRRGVVGAPASVWAPHNEHWSTLPILVWRAIFSVVHLGSYWPYLIPTLLVHLVVVHLVWRRCLRIGTGPWVATGMGLVLGLLGSGAEDLSWAFQLGFLGSLALGLGALDVADSPTRPPSRRRDLLVSALALAAMMCSTVGNATTVALGVTLAVSASWRRLIRVVGPPAACWALWWLLAGRQGMAAMGDHVDGSVLDHAPAFAWNEVVTDVGRAAGLRSLGTLLAVALVAWVVSRLRGLAPAHRSIVGLAAGAATFYFLAALGRDHDGLMTPSRYVYIGAMLLAPAAAGALSFALAAGGVLLSALVRVAVAGLFAAALMANLSDARSFTAARVGFVNGLRTQLEGTAALLADGAPALSTYPIFASGNYSGYLSTSDLLTLWRTGQLPHVPVPTGGQRLDDLSWLDVALSRERLVPGTLTVTSTVGAIVNRVTPGCLELVPTDTYLPGGPSPAVQLALPAGRASGSITVLVSKGSTIGAALAAPGPAPGIAGPVALDAQPLTFGGTRGVINDEAKGDLLVLSLPATTATELCGLGRP
jgi:hypothetical protein